MIFDNNPELKGNLAICEWYQIPQYFQFNDITKNVVLTDNKGYRYLLDCETLKAKKTVGEYTSFDSHSDRPFETSVTLPPPNLYISGDLRKQIKVNNKEINPDLSFLDGQFIADRNSARVYEGIQKKLSLYMIQMEKLYPELHRLNSLNNGTGPPWRGLQRDTLRALENTRYSIERNISDLEDSFTDITRQGYSHRYTQLLSPDTTSFLVFHRSGTEKEARVVISRIERKNQMKLKELWITEVPGLFFDPSAARETTIFREVFSRGNPEFRFSQFELVHNRLVIVWMLHIYCIDIESGKVFWKFRV